MKKLFFVAALGVAGFMNAYNMKASGDETGRSMIWTSTCSINHTTNFPDTWSGQQIAIWVSDQNLKECGVRPRNVTVQLDASMMRIIVEGWEEGGE